MNNLWEYKPDGQTALRHSARFLRSTILPAVSQPGPMSAFPGTMVLAEQRIHRHGCMNSRQIFYVNVDDWHVVDGLWLPNIGRKHRDSLVVDATTLGPKGSRYHKASWAERRNFRHHRSIIAARWRAELAENTPCDLYRSWWQSSVNWLTRKWSNSTAAALRSEYEIVATIKIPNGLCQWQGIPAVKEAWFYPTAIASNLGPLFPVA